MTDLTVTPANVDAGTDGRIGHGIAGEAIDAGEVIYLDRTTNTYLLADADAAASAKAAGVAVSSAAAGQVVAFQSDGTYTAGATTVQGTPYFVSTGAGGIAPFADLGSGDYVTLFGFGVTGNKIKLAINATGLTI
ncbi:MAG: hypothetical protein IPM16_06805 [Chloroflexi bacterium]|nr:hypothetical protein [Chloroflexota bacterium]